MAARTSLRAAALVLWATGPSLAAPARFVDVAAEAGLTLRNVSGGREAKWTILETTGAGACFLDFDTDGDLDLYVVNGGVLPGAGAGVVRDALYENDGAGRFTDVTEHAGLVESGWGGGCTAADYDNDGDPDLYVTNFGRDALLRNQGDSTFRDVTAAAGLGNARWSIGAVFFDAEGDGDLDLYVANYLRFDLSDPEVLRRRCRWKGGEVMCGPRGFDGEADVFYRNRGDGTFEEASAGVWRDASYGMGVVAGDVDGDGDTDLFVANDSQENLLLVNDGAGRFADQALPAGVALSGDGRTQAGMGTDLGDADGDGDEDLFVTHFSDDYHTLYRNDGRLMFTDVTAAAGLDSAPRWSLGWGGGFFDFDNDGDLDLFVAGGHVYPDVERFDPVTSYRQLNRLFENDGTGRYTEVADGGPGLAVPGTGRGAAFGDWDDDGDLDVVVVNIDAPPTLLRNDSHDRGTWLKLRLVGRRSNRDGIGARVALTASGRTQVREVRLSAGYASSHDPRLHFGLRGAPAADRIEVRWPSGHVQQVRDLPAGHLVTLDEERGVSSTARVTPRWRALAAAEPPAATPPSTGVPARPPPPAVPRAAVDLRSIDALVRRATAAVVEGRLHDGIAGYERALASLPPWTAAGDDGSGGRERYRAFLASLHDNLGVALMRAERVEECAAPIERALGLDGGRATFHYNLALCHYHGRRYAAAIAAFEEAGRWPDPPRSLSYDLGRALAGAGRCVEAERMLARAVAELPRPDLRGRDAEAWYHLGDCLADRGRFAEAADAFREALTLVPGHQKALYRLAAAWRRSGRAAAADAAAAVFAARQSADETVRALKRSGARYPAERLRLARLYLDAGLAPQAVQEAQTAAARDARDAAPLVLLGEALLALRPPPLGPAEKAFARALAADPRRVDALAGMGETLRRAGRPAEAARWFRRALDARPDDAAAAVGVARLEVASGDLERGVARLEALRLREPHDPRIPRALAEAFVGAPPGLWRRPEQALALLDRAAGLYGEAVDIRLRALALLGRDADAARLAADTPFRRYGNPKTNPR
jgi:tetratricopeptide (TPR) repeat protein